MDIFNNIFCTIFGKNYSIKTFQDLQKQCLRHNINVFAKSFSIHVVDNPEFWILCHENKANLFQTLSVFSKTGEVINYITEALDLNFESFLFAADRQGTRPIYRNNRELFRDKISPGAVRHLLERASEKLEYVRYISKFNNNKCQTTN